MCSIILGDRFFFIFCLLIFAEIFIFYKKKNFIHQLLRTYQDLFRVLISKQNEEIKQKLILKFSIKLFLYSLTIIVLLLAIFFIFYILNKLAPNFIDIFFNIGDIVFFCIFDCVLFCKKINEQLSVIFKSITQSLFK